MLMVQYGFHKLQCRMLWGSSPQRGEHERAKTCRLFEQPITSYLPVDINPLLILTLLCFNFFKEKYLFITEGKWLMQFQCFISESDR